MSSTGILDAVGIPRRFQTAKLSDLQLPPQEMAKVHDFINRTGPDGLWLYGANGTGKTHAGCAILLDIIQNQREPCYRQDVFGFVSEFTDNKWRIPAKYYQVKVLFLEELGKDIETRVDIPLTIVERIVRWRFENNLRLIVSSNVGVSGIQSRYGDSLASLLTGYCRTVTFKGSDRRLNA